MFALTKWYLDGVDEAGGAVIAYWTRLSLGDHAITWHALTEFPPDAPARSDWSIASTVPPECRGGVVAWRSDALDVSVTMEPADTPADLLLLDRADGVVRWHGETMASRLVVERHGATVCDGTGYAERLTMTIPPWQLPIDTLEWGRWIATDRQHASTWFCWRGPHPLVQVIEDGRPATDPVVDGASVMTATSALVIAPVRLLERRRIRDIVSPIPGLVHLVPDALLAVEETKWLGRGTRRDHDGTTHTGWAIHETVRLR